MKNLIFEDFVQNHFLTDVFFERQKWEFMQIRQKMKNLIFEDFVQNHFSRRTFWRRIRICNPFFRNFFSLVRYWPKMTELCKLGKKMKKSNFDDYSQNHCYRRSFWRRIRIGHSLLIVFFYCQWIGQLSPESKRGKKNKRKKRRVKK